MFLFHCHKYFYFGKYESDFKSNFIIDVYIYKVSITFIRDNTLDENTIFANCTLFYDSQYGIIRTPPVYNFLETILHIITYKEIIQILQEVNHISKHL